MCALIGQQACFLSTMKHENDWSDAIGCLQAVRNYTKSMCFVYGISFFKSKK